MATSQRPIHRGINEAALFHLKETRQPAKLAGCLVSVHEIQPNGDGQYFVMVSGTVSTSPYWIDVTTCSYEAKQERVNKFRAHARKTAKSVPWA